MLLLGELTDSIIGSFYTAYGKLGYGFLEKNSSGEPCGVAGIPNTTSPDLSPRRPCCFRVVRELPLLLSVTRSLQANGCGAGPGHYEPETLVATSGVA
jgi:hypothetical protein